jgi:GT2 family glycosyltransferase
MEAPRLSVIVPAYQGARVLGLSLAALTRSTLPRDQWELIVVDDASTDDTSVVAARFADVVVRLPGKPHGPAYARNRGFEASCGDIVVFVDADVCVHADTLARFVQVFDERPDVSAAFGSYDASPSHPGVISEFRNLLHHHVHHRDAGDAETFWAGCGAVRASAFRGVGLFDEWHYARPQIEDIELGRRLRIRGHRILLRPEIQGTHLKRWTLRDVMSTDFMHRGIPWTRLLLHEGPNRSQRALNLRASERACTALAGLGWLSLLAAALLRSTVPLIMVAVVVVSVIIANRTFYQFVTRERGLRVALLMLPLHLMYYGTNVFSAIMGWTLHVLLGEPQAPITVAATVGMDIKIWPPRPSRPRAGLWSLPVGMRPPGGGTRRES